MITYKEYLNALTDAGLHKGITVLVHSGISLFGKPDVEAKKKSILKFYFDGLLEVIGKEGTLVTPAFTGTSYVRNKIAYDVTTTKSEVGAFSNYILEKKNAIRSFHPIVSLVAVGKNAEKICGGHHFDGYGYDSPWGRLLETNSKILTLGYAIYPSGMSAIHFLENMLGVPYQYTKIFESNVFYNKQKIEGLFTMSVRYLQYEIDHDQSEFKKILVDQGLAKIIKLGSGKILSTSFRELFQCGKKTFAKNRYILLKNNPKFSKNKIPLI